LKTARQSDEKALFSVLLHKTEKVYKERFRVRLLAVFNVMKKSEFIDMR